MSSNTSEFVLLLRLRVAEQEAAAAREKIRLLEEGTKKAGERANQAASAFRQIKQASSEFEQIGSRMALMGGAIVAPLVLGATKYVQQAGLAEATSRRWRESTYSLEQSQMRIGRITAEQIAPAMEKAAELAEKVAGFVEQHPEAIKAALMFGTLLLSTGGVIKIAGAGGKLIGTAGQLLGGSGALGGIGASGAAAVAAPAALAAAGGLGLGFGVNEILARTVGGPFQKFGKFATTAAYGEGRVLDTLTGQKTDIKSQQLALIVARLTGEIDANAYAQGKLAIQMQKGTAATNEATTAQQHNQSALQNSPMMGAAVEAYIGYRTQEAQATKVNERRKAEIIAQGAREQQAILESYSEQRLLSIRNFEEQQAEAVAAHQKDMMRQAEDFSESQRRSEVEYYKARLQASEEFGITTKRYEEQHQKEIANLLDDHNERLAGLAAERDALGIVREMRRYEKERQEKEAGYATETSQRNEDFNRRRAEMEREFSEQRAQRLEDFEKRQKQEQSDFDDRLKLEQKHQDESLALLDERQRKELEKARQSNQEQLSQLEEHYQEEMAARDAAFHDQLLQLDDHLTGETDKRAKFYEQMTKDLEAWLKGTGKAFKSNLPGFGDEQTQPTGNVIMEKFHPPRYHSGGYTRPGLGVLKQGEFVLDPDTVSAAERMAGARLNQDNVLGAIARGVSGGANGMTLNANLSFGGSFSESDRAWVKEEVRAGAVEAFAEVLSKIEVH